MQPSNIQISKIVVVYLHVKRGSSFTLKFLESNETNVA